MASKKMNLMTFRVRKRHRNEVKEWKNGQKIRSGRSKKRAMRGPVSCGNCPGMLIYTQTDPSTQQSQYIGLHSRCYLPLFCEVTWAFPILFWGSCEDLDAAFWFTSEDGVHVNIWNCLTCSVRQFLREKRVEARFVFNGGENTCKERVSLLITGIRGWLRRVISAREFIGDEKTFLSTSLNTVEKIQKVNNVIYIIIYG